MDKKYYKKLRITYIIEAISLFTFFILLLIGISNHFDNLILISMYGLILSSFWFGYHSRKLAELEKK